MLFRSISSFVRGCNLIGRFIVLENRRQVLVDLEEDYQHFR
jgi:hypothetical protein